MKKDDFYINFIIHDENKNINQNEITKLIKKKDKYFISVQKKDIELKWENDDDSWSLKLYELLLEYINENRINALKVNKNNGIQKESSGYYLLENENSIKLSSDLMGVSKTYLNENINIKDEFILDRTLAGKIVWPKIHFGINNSRGGSYKGVFDRIDFTLYLIKIYYMVLNDLKDYNTSEVAHKIKRHNDFLCKSKSLLDFKYTNASFDAYQSINKLFVAFDEAKKYFEIFIDENNNPSFYIFSKFWGLVSENDNNFIKVINNECYVRNLKSNLFDENKWFFDENSDFQLIPNKYYVGGKSYTDDIYHKNIHSAINERRKEMMKNVGIEV